MIMHIPDVDLDISDREKILTLFPAAICASQLTGDKQSLVSHNTGVYFQQIPTDPLNGLATFPYDVAEQNGYYKLDFIPFHVYDNIHNEQELIELLEFVESDNFKWDWFEDLRFFDHDDPKHRVTHIGGYYDLCQQYPPKTVEDVAILIALIRPRKKYLIGEDWDVIKSMIWKKLPEEDGQSKSGNYFFKKSHAVGYALVVLVHMAILAKRMK